MPATKKTKSGSAKIEKQLTKMSEQMNALLVVFALGMMLLAFVLYTVYAK